MLQTRTQSNNFSIDSDYTIEAGDYISSNGFVGRVIGVGAIRFGKGSIPGYRVHTASGREDFIPADGARLLGGVKPSQSRL